MTFFAYTIYFFLSRLSVGQAWQFTRDYLSGFSKDWLGKLELHRQDLAIKALRINADARRGGGIGDDDDDDDDYDDDDDDDYDEF